MKHHRRRYARRFRSGPDVWVVRAGTGFVAKEQGVHEPLTPVTTQARAIITARAAAKHNRSELIVQGRNTLIRLKNSYGRDPRSRRG